MRSFRGTEVVDEGELCLFFLVSVKTTIILATCLRQADKDGGAL